MSKPYHSNSNSVTDDIRKSVGKVTRAINIIIFSTFSENSHEYIQKVIYIQTFKILLKEHQGVQKIVGILGGKKWTNTKSPITDTEVRILTPPKKPGKNFCCLVTLMSSQAWVPSLWKWIQSSKWSLTWTLQGPFVYSNQTVLCL